VQRRPSGPCRDEDEVALADDGRDGIASRAGILDDLGPTAPELRDHVGIGALGDDDCYPAANRGAGDDGDRDREVTLGQVP
jgi:hypothetical protein